MVTGKLALVVITLSLPVWGNAQPVVNLAKDKFEPAEVVAGGQKFTLDMGRKRMNWTHARWSVHHFDVPRDWRAFGGIELVVSTDRPRSDAGVYVAVKEADGSWYYAGWAANLIQAENRGVVKFVDFAPTDYMSPPGGSHFDENMILDLDQIKAVAIGCVNPLGVGTVSFTLRALNLVPAAKLEPVAAKIRVTGKLLDVNGTTTVPAGLFGAFNLKQIAVDGQSKERTGYYRLALDRRINHSGFQDKPIYGNEITHMLINSVGDRTSPSPRFTLPNWREKYTADGKAFGEAVKAAGRVAYVEFWNEPYLNWANINRKNFDPKFFDESKAEEGGAVTIKHDGTVAPHLRWTKDFNAPPWNWNGNLREWRRGRDAKGNWTLPYAMPYSGWSPPKWRAEAQKLNPPDETKDGETYTAGNGKEYTAFTPWHVYDETQFTYWSGKGMLKPYIEPMVAYGQAMKEVAGDMIVYIVGWGNRVSEDHWAGFHQLYKDTIDAAPKIIDGVCDHDYGGSPTKMPASYEVVTAYGMTRYGRWLYNFNTETAMGSDPQAYPEAAGLPKGALADLNKFRWTSAKLLHALQFVPDKARSFSWFGIGGNWFSDEGEGVALTALKNLRGKLVQVINDDPNLYVVAAIDGTDPLNPRPVDMPQRQELVVAAFNDTTTSRPIELTITMPAGTTYSEIILRQPALDTATGKMAMNEKNIAGKGSSYTHKGELPARSLLVLTFPLVGTVGDKAEVHQRQFFAKTILADVKPSAPVSDTIAIAPDALTGAKRAWLRFVTERLAEGEGVVVINGTEYALPAAPTPENTPALRQLPVDVAGLKPQTEVQFKVTSPAHAGYLLGTASLIVEK